MTRVLLTGASGFIGRNLVEGLSGNFELVAPPRRELDLLDEGAVSAFLKAGRFDVVLHCANEDKDAARILPNNCRMLSNLARAATQYGRLITLGSGAEFDRRHWRLGMRESDFDAHVPADDYGFSKYLMAREVERMPGAVHLRLFAIFGKHEDWTRRFISNACVRAAWDLPVTIRWNARFDYLWVGDFVRVCQWFLEHEAPERVYNVCTGTVLDLRTLADKVLAACGKRLDVCIAEEESGDDYGGDNARLRRDTGGFEFRDIDQSIGELYRWYEAQRERFPREQLLEAR